jgi:hypothetical protein
MERSDIQDLTADPDSLTLSGLRQVSTCQSFTSEVSIATSVCPVALVASRMTSR